MKQNLMKLLYNSKIKRNAGNVQVLSSVDSSLALADEPPTDAEQPKEKDSTINTIYAP